MSAASWGWLGWVGVGWGFFLWSKSPPWHEALFPDSRPRALLGRESCETVSGESVRGSFYYDRQWRAGGPREAVWYEMRIRTVSSSCPSRFLLSRAQKFPSVCFSTFLGSKGIQVGLRGHLEAWHAVPATCPGAFACASPLPGAPFLRPAWGPRACPLSPDSTFPSPRGAVM